MLRSIATVSLGGDLVEKLRAISAAGFGGVEIFEEDLLASALPPVAVRQICEDLGLKVVLLQPFRNFEGVGPVKFKQNIARAKNMFSVASDLEADCVLVCSNVSPDTIDDDDLIVDQLRTLAGIAQEAGVKAGFEALAWGAHINSYRHAWRLVEAVDHPFLGLILDSFHTLSINDSVEEISRIPGERIAFVQIADAPRIDMDVLELSRHHRCFPGDGAFDIGGFLGSLMQSGYKGPLSLEIFNDRLRGAPLWASAAQGYVALTKLIGQRSV